MASISALIFDLDGTLYFNAGLEAAINNSACRYLADLKGLESGRAAALLRETKAHLSADNRTATLSHSILELGGDLRALHAHFAAEIHPEAFLSRDERVMELLTMLAEHFGLHIYTNNNKVLATAILKQLGIAPLFSQLFTIEDAWQPKPNREILTNIFHTIGRQAAECMFIGDRYDVDLRLPAEMGSQVFSVNNIDDLLSLSKLIIKENQ